MSDKDKSKTTSRDESSHRVLLGTQFDKSDQKYPNIADKMLNHPTEIPNSLAPETSNERPILFGCPPSIPTPAEFLERLFERHGARVARHPWLYIIGCLLFAIACSFALPLLHWENNIVKMWNPTDSETYQNFVWLWKNHPPDNRIHSVIFISKSGRNVLTPDNIKKMYEIYEKVQNIQGQNNSTWRDVCVKVPVVPPSYAEMLHDISLQHVNSNNGGQNQIPDGSSPPSVPEDDFFDDGDQKVFDPSVDYYPQPYCSIVNSFSETCFSDSILELFSKNGNLEEGTFDVLTQDDIVNKLNGDMISELYKIPKDFHSFLGGVVSDQHNRIIGAEATIMYFFSRMNATETHLKQVKEESILGEQLSLEQLDVNTKIIEDNLIDMLFEERQMLQSDNDTDLMVEFMVAKSFPDTINKKITSNIPKIAGSFLIMFVYVCLSLGNFNCVENRVYLSIMGLFSVMLSFATSYGLCSLLGFTFSPLHNFIPFLLLGLGVDDMFVIVQALDTVEREFRQKEGTDNPARITKMTTEVKFGKILRRSGVAITVTSLTDFIAFAVGGTTTLPALRSFCLFCGVGILSVYLYQANWFIAWMVIDERRKEANRNAFCPCIVQEKKNVEQQRCSNFKARRGRWLYKYGTILSKTPARVVVITITAVVLAVSMYGNYELVEEFDPWLFIPKDLYVSKWKYAQDRLFPSKGERVYIFFADDDMLNWPKLDQLVTSLQNQTDILTSLDSWYIYFKDYWEYNFKKGDDDEWSKLSDIELQSFLVRFLYSPMGTRYRFLFDVLTPISCGNPLPTVKLHIMTVSHKIIHSSLEGISAMNRIKQIIKQQQFEGHVFPFSPLYSIWEIDEIIRSELHRNVSLAIFSIYFATVFLLSDFKASIFVLICVFITLANVSGIMHFWDLKIDTVTCTVLIVCIGLSVDFSAHVVHAYMQQGGHDRGLRVTKSLVAIAPAVLHGGFSTFLAVILLSVSDVYVLKTFFKIFVLVILFGLFNGLVFLPVVLGIIGPKSSENEVVAEEEALTKVNDDKSEVKASNGQGADFELKSLVI